MPIAMVIRIAAAAALLVACGSNRYHVGDVGDAAAADVASSPSSADVASSPSSADAPSSPSSADAPSSPSSADAPISKRSDAPSAADAPPASPCGACAGACCHLHPDMPAGVAWACTFPACNVGAWIWCAGAVTRCSSAVGCKCE